MGAGDLKSLSIQSSKSKIAADEAARQAEKKELAR
jgi:hypothetical protein